MKILRIRTLAALIFTLGSCAVASGQQDDKGTLYFPPKLAVTVAADANWFDRLYGRPEREDASTASRLANRIVFTRDFEEKELTPLPMVFFDQGSYAIPQRYQQFTGSGQTDGYIDSGIVKADLTIDGADKPVKYYELLNIIGYRLAGIPEATVALEGGYSTEPGESAELATERARVVFEYLTTIWDIEPSRIALLPPRRMCDSTANVFRQEEARRVIFHVSDFDLIGPVRYRTSSVRTALLLFSILIDPQVPAGQVSGIELVIASDDDVLSRTSVPISPDSTVYRQFGVWGIPRSLEFIGEELVVQAFVHTTDMKTRATNQVFIPITIEDEKSEGPGEMLSFSDERDGERVDSTADDYEISVAQYQAYYAWTPFTDSIPFFESSDTALAGLQTMWLRRCLDSITHRFAATANSGRWELFIAGSGEAGDFQDIDNGELESNRATYRSLEGFYEGLGIDRSFQMPLLLIPGLDPASGKDFDVNRFISDLIVTWYGDRTDEFVETSNQRSSTSHYRFPIEDMRSRADSFLSGRARAVSRALVAAPGFDMSRIDTMYNVARTPFGAVPFKYSPEERFYARTVSIAMNRSSGTDAGDAERGESAYGDGYFEGMPEEESPENHDEAREEFEIEHESGESGDDP